MTKKVLLTSHNKNNPLLVALQDQNIQIEYISGLNAKLSSTKNYIGYYGNIFSEIKSPLRLSLFLKQLRRKQIPYIFWNRDAPWNVGMKRHRQFFLENIKPIDIYLTHSLQDSHIFSNKPHYFPNAAKLIYYKDTDLPALREESQYKYDISFIGSVGNKKRRACRERLSLFSAIKEKVLQKDSTLNILLVDTVNRKLDIAEQLTLIRNTKVNLNFGAMCDLPKNPSWGLPERVFGIPAVGGFLLTDYRKSIQQTFSQNSCDTFIDVEDCTNKIIYYTSHFQQLRNRAEKLHKQIIEQHTYMHRAEHLLQLLK